MGIFEDTFSSEDLAQSVVQDDPWSVFGGDTVDVNNVVNIKSVYDSRQERSVNFPGSYSSDNIQMSLDRDVGDSKDYGFWSDMRGKAKQTILSMTSGAAASLSLTAEAQKEGIRMPTLLDPILGIMGPLFGWDAKQQAEVKQFAASQDEEFYDKVAKGAAKQAAEVELSEGVFEGDLISNPSWRRAFGELTAGITSVGVSSLATLIAGPEAAGVLIGSSEAGQLALEAKEAGVPIRERLKLAGTVGPIVALMEKLNLDLLIGESGEKLVQKYAGQAVGKRLGISFLAGGISEGLTEVGQKLTGDTAWNQIVAQAGYAKAKEYQEGLIDTFIISFATGGLFSGGKTGLSLISEAVKKADRSRANVENSGVPKEVTDQAISELGVLIDENKDLVESAISESKQQQIGAEIAVGRRLDDEEGLPTIVNVEGEEVPFMDVTKETDKTKLKEYTKLVEQRAKEARSTATFVESEVQKRGIRGLVAEYIQTANVNLLRPRIIFEEMGMQEVGLGLEKAYQNMITNIKMANSKIDSIFSGLDPIALQADSNQMGRFNDFTTSFAMFVYAHSKSDVNRRHLKGSGLTDQEINDFSKWLEDNNPAAKQTVDNLQPYFDEQYIRINEVYKRLTGKDLPKREYYMPINTLDVQQGEQEFEAFGDVYNRASGPGRSFTKETKINSNKAYADMDIFYNIQKNANAVERYISLAESVKGAKAILGNKKNQEAISSAVGPKHVPVANKIIDKIANINQRQRDSLDEIAGTLRRNHAITMLTGNLATITKQVPSLLSGLYEVGLTRSAAGVSEFASNYSTIVKTINEKSSMMRNRKGTHQREFIEMLEATNKPMANKLVKQIKSKKEYKLYDKGLTRVLNLISDIDLAVTQTVWWSAYKAGTEIDEMSEVEAAAYADRMVNTTQPMGGTAYLPLIMQGSEISKTFTMYMNQPNQNFNQLYDSLSKLYGGKKNLAQFAGDNIAYAIMPAIAMFLISHGRLPEDEDELTKSIVQQYVSGIPIFRDIARGRLGGPIATLVEETARAKNGKQAKTKIKSGLRAAGVLTGKVPAIQLIRVYDAIKEKDIKKLLGIR